MHKKINKAYTLTIAALFTLTLWNYNTHSTPKTVIVTKNITLQATKKTTYNVTISAEVTNIASKFDWSLKLTITNKSNKIAKFINLTADKCFMAYYFYPYVSMDSTFVRSYTFPIKLAKCKDEDKLLKIINIKPGQAFSRTLKAGNILKINVLPGKYLFEFDLDLTDMFSHLKTAHKFKIQKGPFKIALTILNAYPAHHFKKDEI